MFVTRDEYQNRLTICESCNHKQTTLNINVCGLCGCVIRTKASVSNQSCPDNKWNTSKSQEEKTPNDTV
jgi:hypothetical protein